jgi:hypothetical protein
LEKVQEKNVLLKQKNVCLQQQNQQNQQNQQEEEEEEEEEDSRINRSININNNNDSSSKYKLKRSRHHHHQQQRQQQLQQQQQHEEELYQMRCLLVQNDERSKESSREMEHLKKEFFSVQKLLKEFKKNQIERIFLEEKQQIEREKMKNNFLESAIMEQVRPAIIQATSSNSITSSS